MNLLADHINNLVKEIYSRKSPIFAEISLNWGKIVGKDVEQVSRPFNMVTNYQTRITTLHVAVSSSSSMLNISFQKDIILERIAVYLGFKAIHKINLMVMATKE